MSLQLNTPSSPDAGARYIYYLRVDCGGGCFGGVHLVRVESLCSLDATALIFRPPLSCPPRPCHSVACSPRASMLPIDSCYRVVLEKAMFHLAFPTTELLTTTTLIRILLIVPSFLSPIPSSFLACYLRIHPYSSTRRWLVCCPIILCNFPPCLSPRPPGNPPHRRSTSLPPILQSHPASLVPRLPLEPCTQKTSSTTQPTLILLPYFHLLLLPTITSSINVGCRLT